MYFKNFLIKIKFLHCSRKIVMNIIILNLRKVLMINFKTLGCKHALTIHLLVANGEPVKEWFIQT